MTHAQYGRMRMGRCVKLDYGHMGCASDVIEQTDGRCSGRRQCEIRIPDALFAETLPCPDDLKPYLEASFRCVKGQSLKVTSSRLAFGEAQRRTGIADGGTHGRTDGQALTRRRTDR